MSDESNRILNKRSPEFSKKIKEVDKARDDYQVLTLREWYDSTEKHSSEILEYMQVFKQLGPLGKELHNRGFDRVTERYGDSVRTLVEATYHKKLLDSAAPLCALACLVRKKSKDSNKKSKNLN